MYEYKATLVKVVDGDTVDVDLDLGFSIVLSNQRIRLYGIDTPESRTRDPEEKKCGKLAGQYLIDNLGTEFVVKTHKDDARGKYGRILGELMAYSPEKDAVVSLNREMIEKKLAVAYFGQSKDDIEAEHQTNREYLYEQGLVSRPSE